jgi:high affinity Mn2+ porin
MGENEKLTKHAALPLVIAVALMAALVSAQEAQAPAAQEPATPAEEQRWNLHWQATSIGQTHDTFRAPYEGTNSLENRREYDVSITTTFFLGLRLFKNTQLYFNPEVAGGNGFSRVTGITNFPNGEIPRVGSATPRPYLARLYITQDFGFGSERESFESDENQLAGTRPMTRYSVTIGRFTVTDFFDNNRYSHEPRTQFMGWGVMYNGAWDYPADVHGYTWGWVHEFHTRRWTLRYGSGAEPRVANGLRLDHRIFVNRGDLFEGEVRYTVGDHPGAVRLLGFLHHSNSGTYSEAIRLAEQTGTTPDVTATRKNGTLKYGSGISAEQEIRKDIGVFARLGWNDGKTESFAFTAIDRLGEAGVSVTGSRWRRPYDTVGTAYSASGLAGIHALYLARGGLDFIIGDGKLNYGPEMIWESYYSYRVLKGFFASLDFQHVTNPAFNRDRGPVWVSSLRLHLEYGK